MAIKTVICAVCGQEVPKSQTVAISPTIVNGPPPDRACKTHPEAIEKAEALNKANKERIQRMTTPKPSREDYLNKKIEERNQLSSDIDKGLKRCWCCGNPGIYSNEYYSILWHVSVLAGGVNPLSAEYKNLIKTAFIKLFGEVVRPLILVRSEDVMAIKGKAKYRDLREMTQITPICNDCLKIHKHEHLWPKVEMNADQLKAWAVISEFAKESVLSELNGGLSHV